MSVYMIAPSVSECVRTQGAEMSEGRSLVIAAAEEIFQALAEAEENAEHETQQNDATDEPDPPFVHGLRSAQFHVRDGFSTALSFLRRVYLLTEKTCLLLGLDSILESSVGSEAGGGTVGLVRH